MTTIEYNKCVDTFADRVFRFVLKNIKDEEKAKDIVQDTFTKMWEKVENVDSEKAKSYLFTTAYHTTIDYFRKEKHLQSLDEVYESQASTLNNYSDLKEVLDEALSTMSEIQRSVVLLRDYEGYSYNEIGEITGLNESQVKVYIYRARLFLKNYIGKPENVV